MKSLLQSLYDGEMFPSEAIISKDTEYRTIHKKINEEMAHFKQKLSEEDYQRLEEFDNLHGQTVSIDSETSFMYGFRLGALLMVEVFTGKEELVRSGNK